MAKVTITLDLTKIDKSRITERTWEGGASKDYKVELVELKEPKVIKEGSTWRMVKKYFVADLATKEERAEKKKMNIVGDGIVFEDLTQVASSDVETPF